MAVTESFRRSTTGSWYLLELVKPSQENDSDDKNRHDSHDSRVHRRPVISTGRETGVLVLFESDIREAIGEEAETAELQCLTTTWNCDWLLMCVSCRQYPFYLPRSTHGTLSA